MLRTSVLGLVVTSGFAVYASSLFPVPRPLGHDHAIDPRLQVLAMGSVFGRAEVSGSAVGNNNQYVDTGLSYMTRRRQGNKEVAGSGLPSVDNQVTGH
jgi:hypothetical protein